MAVSLEKNKFLKIKKEGGQLKCTIASDQYYEMRKIKSIELHLLINKVSVFTDIHLIVFKVYN